MRQCSGPFDLPAPAGKMSSALYPQALRHHAVHALFGSNQLANSAIHGDAGGQDRLDREPIFSVRRVVASWRSARKCFLYRVSSHEFIREVPGTEATPSARLSACADRAPRT